jgi:FlaA1/EpsC-like NDP-sugar epimerase
MKQKETGVLPITDERMTRFNITLQDGVDFVLKCLGKMWGGELFVPKIPSYRILDVAQAIDPECEHKIIGIRPGEKLHEEMITETDAINCVEFGKYYVILPAATLWDVEKFKNESNSSVGEMCEYGFSYDSKSNKDFLTLNDLKELIKNHI